MPTRTFLFSDIEGSTRLWRDHPETMGEALATHDQLVGRLVDAERGRIFKHTGDGIAAVFESADDALRAAAGMQQALLATPHEELGTLRVRIGIHTGEAEERGSDFFGYAVSRTARLMSAGHGGQTLVSLVSEQLASDDAFRLRDLGEHRLPDLTRPERIFQLVVDGIEQDFPPLRTIDDSPNNLPVLTTSFIGRDQELAEVEKLIGAARLVTITGVGGSGKTRVALHAAADLAADHPGGVWLVELAPVTDPDLVDAAVVTSLEAVQASGKSARDAALEHLADREALLVIDNCEHVIGAAAEMIEAILTHAPDVRVVATSRELLGVPGEVSYGLRSMQLPRSSDPEVLRTSDAVRLFEERASATKPGFEITDENIGPIAETCRRLDGMPLAIELAAARLRSFSPAQIAEHLDQRFRLLTGGSRTALPRQQTLTATIDWSYRLLGDDEAALFRRLSVFQGGCTFEATRAVCTGGPVDELDLFELVPALVDKSLLIVEDDRGDARYRLLETLRQFARDRLDETGEADHWRSRHAEYFADLSRMATTENLNGPKGPEWVARILAEADNFRQAITWALGADRPEIALGAAYGLSRVLMGRGRWSEPLAIYRRISPARGELPDHLQAELLFKLGRALVESPDPDEGVRLLEESIEIYEELDRSGTDPGLLTDRPRAILALAVALFHQDRVGEHNELFVELAGEALEIARERGDIVMETVALANLAHHRDPRGDPSETRALFDEAEAAAAASGMIDPDAIASQRAYFEFDQRELQAAHDQWVRALAFGERTRAFDRFEEAACLAAVEILQGDDSGRERFDREIESLFEDADIRTGLRHHQTLLAFRAGLDADAGLHSDVAIAAGATDAIRAATGNAVRWDLRSFLAEAEAAARAALGEQEFERLRSRGVAMTPEEVTAFLLPGSS